MAIRAICIVFLLQSGWLRKWDDGWIKSWRCVLDMDLQLPKVCKSGVLPYYGAYEAEPFESRDVSGCLGERGRIRTRERKLSS